MSGADRHWSAERCLEVIDLDPEVAAPAAREVHAYTFDGLKEEWGDIVCMIPTREKRRRNIDVAPLDLRRELRQVVPRRRERRALHPEAFDLKVTTLGKLKVLRRRTTYTANPPCGRCPSVRPTLGTTASAIHICKDEERTC